MRSLVVAVVACVTLVACGGAEDSGAGLRGGLTGNEGDDVEQPSDDAGTVVEQDAGSDPLVADAAMAMEQDAGSAPVVVAGEQDAGSAPSESGTDAASAQPQLPACTAQWYRDADGDGFGAGAALISCSQPTGYVRNSSDCYDGNKDARPGQVGIFGEHRGDGSFDYNCDGVESKQIEKLATCPVMTVEDNSCPPPNFPSAWDDQPRSCYEALRARFDAVRDGWWETEAPACGQIGRWDLTMKYTRGDGYTCLPPHEFSSQRQPCR